MKTRESVIECAFATPGAPASIQIPELEFRRIKNTVLASMAAGREVAGFLLGTTAAAAPVERAPSLVTLDKFAMLWAKCSSDLFSYAAVNPEILQQQLQSFRGRAQVVGFFRANLRSDRSPTQDDLALMKDLFHSRGVLLLIDGSQEPYSAVFYSSDPHKGSTLRATLPIWFGDYPSDGSAPDVRSSAVPNMDRHVSALPDEDRGVRPALLGSWMSGWNAGRIGFVLAGIAVLTLGGLQYRTMNLLKEQRHESPDASGTLGLKTERAGAENQWRILWSKSSMAVRKAGKGHISIRDGYLRKELDLATEDLQRGSIIYSPVSDDVTFRLEVVDLEAGRSVGESIRVLANPWPYGADAVYNESKTPEMAVPSVRRAPLSRGRSANLTSGHSTDSELEPDEKGNPATPQEAVYPRPFRAPVREPVIVSRSVNDLPVPPALPNAAPVARFSLPSSVATENSAILPQPRVTKTAQSDDAGAVSASRSDNIDNKSEDASRPQEPKLLRRTDPLYPQTAIKMGLSGSVQVQATIGADGRVRDVRAVSGPPLLQHSAVDAVKTWVYLPARLHGRAVPAPISIEIRFNQHGTKP